MGYAIATGTCYCCGRIFYFNPVRVPSARDQNGEKQPVCKNCILEVNRRKAEMGLPEFVVPDDAYEPVNEMEL